MSSDRCGRNPMRVATSMVVILIVVLLAGAVLLQYSLDNAFATRQGWEKSAPFDTGRSALDLLGGARETLAAYFWTKTDTVFHEYMGSDPEKTQYMYPYYWLITRLDPHFIIAYYYASWYLCRLGRVDKGLDLALDGVKHNPNSATLQENLSQIYLFFKGDPEKARYHCLKAISLEQDEEERAVMRTFLTLIDDVLAGRVPVPKVTTFEQLRKASEQLEEHEEHDHEHHEH
ncbi:MAG: hypothetical protein JJE48_00865 [Actinobacteria bacterium]|nr:hypothetical protein [Actinomycetota bacterium]